jgi:hypothetical protein
MINRLMILCSRLNPNSRDLSEIENILESELDWKRLLKKAADERVGPLLYHNLKKFKNQIPESAMEGLKKAYYLNTARNNYKYKKLEPLLEAIHDSRLRVAVIKGARLAKTLYPDIGLRPFTDVDLVVHPSDWSQLEKVFEKLGFSGDEYVKQFLNNTKEELYWTFSPLYQKDRLMVELHFNYPGLGIPIRLDKDLWESSQNIEILDTEARSFSLEYELCILCLHAQQHAYNRLIWLTDIAELLSQERIDWERVIYLCQEEEICAPVYYGLKLVDCFWPGTVSKNILARFKLSPFERKFLRYFWPEERILSRELCFKFPWKTPTFFPLLSRKRIFLKSRILFNIFFPPRAWVSYYYHIPANSIKIFSHYLWRLYTSLWLFSKLFIR